MAHIGTTAAQFLNKVNWRLLIEGATTIVNTALSLSDRIEARNKERQRRSPGADTDTFSMLLTDVTEIKERLDTMEGESREHAELISRMAAQEEAMLRGIEALSTRVSKLFWASIGVGALAIAALLVALLSPQ